MKIRLSSLGMVATLLVTLSVVAEAQAKKDCKLSSLRGEYIFSATGYTRSPSTPGWVPKAIVEMIRFNGDGTLTTPALTLANPANDAGITITPPNGGSPGSYTVEDDCTGTINFNDGVAFRIYVAPLGDSLWMIQTQGLPGSQNVFQGKAERVWM